jgi:hypothetical protein
MRIIRNTSLSASLKVEFIVFMERYLTRIGKILLRLALSHAVPAGSREVTATFRFISENTVVTTGL